MEPFDNPEALARQMTSDLERIKSRPAIIGIDGMYGAGKTWLTQKLEVLIPAPAVYLDCHIDKKQDGYVPFLRIDDVQCRLSDADRVVLVDGVCLLAAAERCGFKVDKLVYVKRMTPYGSWADFDLCDPEQDPDEMIRKEMEQSRMFNEEMGSRADHEPGPSGLDQELIRYHVAHVPVARADYIFCNVRP